MIMVVIGVAVVLVHEILAEDMVGERVALFLVVIVGHSNLLPGTPARSYRPRRVIARRICQGQNASALKEIARRRPLPPGGRLHTNSWHQRHAFGFIDSAG